MDLNRPKLKQLAISKIPLFQNLDASEHELLGDKLVLREFKKGDVILSAGQTGRDLMFVADGAVDVKRSNTDGREVIVSRLEVGEFFGEISLLTSSTRTADVVAAEDSMVLILQATDFEAFLAGHPAFSRALLVHLAHRVAAASTRVADLALLDVYCRVYKVLCSLAKANPSGTPIISELPTHRELAAMVGTSREMVTRALARLNEDQVIETTESGLSIVGHIPNC